MTYDQTVENVLLLVLVAGQRRGQAHGPATARRRSALAELGSAMVGQLRQVLGSRRQAATQPRSQVNGMAGADVSLELPGHQHALSRI